MKVSEIRGEEHENIRVLFLWTGFGPAPSGELFRMCVLYSQLFFSTSSDVWEMQVLYLTVCFF